MITDQKSAQQKVPVALDDVLSEAQALWDAGAGYVPSVGDPLKAALDYIHSESENSSSAFTNIVTALAIKGAFPTVDIRYHQEQIQDQTDRGAGFSFRTLSETIVYPWLSGHQFDGAKSGWQTRTFERNDPYTLSYPHKIGGAKVSLKENFLRIYSEVEEQGESAADALRYLFYLQVQKRHTQTVDLAVPRTDDISLIVGLLTSHFYFQYTGKGASRLPVLAIHAIYQLITEQLKRFEGMTLKPLQAHSAADVQTGSVGDIEVEDAEGGVFEALEIKHGQKIDLKVLTDVEDKISRSNVSRYYVLTTHDDCGVAEDAQHLITRIDQIYRCRVIVNGVQASLRYYLRLLDDPSAIFEKYVALLNVESAISFEHRAAWNAVVDQAIAQ